MREFNEFINAVLSDMSANEWFWPAVAACAVVIILLFWLVVRRIRLWYWKVNAQVNALEKIDLSLQKIERGLSGYAEEAGEDEPREAEPPEADESKTREAEDDRYGRGKSGRVYTEAELEALIRE